ncbi:acetyl-CoA carboxylase biotin carboxyl carrier protein subunit [Rathayibacter sp. VKM Ac-2759]|nr:acetyl-CoA carboxylase biotin carboxyl carrier protein subunit [Rathayibacter sp. VKM Ac-2759]
MGGLRQELAELARILPGDLRRLRVRGGDREIEVEWADRAAPSDPLAERQWAPRPEDPTTAVPSPAQDETLAAVRAPLVGSYFSAPSPGAEPFVQVGDRVEADTTVAIIEAMKLMNPIPAGRAGIVAELPVGNGDAVEYDQVILRLRPTGQTP